MCLGGTLYFRNLLFLKFKVSSNLHLPNANAAFLNLNNFIFRLKPNEFNGNALSNVVASFSPILQAKQ